MLWIIQFVIALGFVSKALAGRYIKLIVCVLRDLVTWLHHIHATVVIKVSRVAKKNSSRDVYRGSTYQNLPIEFVKYIFCLSLVPKPLVSFRTHTQKACGF